MPAEWKLPDHKLYGNYGSPSAADHQTEKVLSHESHHFEEAVPPDSHHILHGLRIEDLITLCHHDEIILVKTLYAVSPPLNRRLD